jgi:mannitol-1-phosphate 5-dehydrogenase
MNLHGEDRTFVCFGFGAIGAGLMLYEAARSGAFRRLVVAEVVPETVAALRAASGRYTVNVARPDRVDAEAVGPVEAFNPTRPDDRAALVAAVAGSGEMATAVPSVDFYARGGASSLAGVLAEGLALRAARPGARTVVYAAENHNRAAEMLQESVLERVPAREREKVRGCTAFLNTVIGKMSGVVTDGPGGRKLVPVTPGSARAFLVEEFNRILVSRPGFPEPFARSLAVFEEKPDLLPFEEAKLYGHNAAHALAAYLGRLLGVPDMSALRAVPGFMEFVRAAFLEESGEALRRRHRGLDPLFTPAGYAAYADDLLARMTNPFLGDTIERVTRDPARKLGWDDRLVGTMRTALAEGVQPRRFAIGAAAALAALDAEFLGSDGPAARWLAPLWGASAPVGAGREAVLSLVEDGRRFLRSPDCVKRLCADPLPAV